MTWQGIQGHDEVAAQFQVSLQRGRLGSTFLFVGAPGIGKRMFAIRLAQTLLCDRSPPVDFAPCGACPDCQQVLAGTHPDLEQLAKPADKRFIPLDLLIGDKQHRMREGLCARMSLRPARGRRKIAILDDADDLSIDGANCMLKTLEEPPSGSLLILIGTSPQRQLPTIRSRCQIVRFQSLEPSIAAQLLIDRQVVQDPDEALRLAKAANGSLTRAGEMAAPELWRFRADLHKWLDVADWNSLELAKTITSFVEEAGSGAPERRKRLHHVLEMAIDFYRNVLYAASGAPLAGASSPQLAELWSGDPERAIHCLERCLAATAHVNANANMSTNIDAWVDELSQIALGNMVADFA